MKIDKNKTIINIDVIAADTLEIIYDNHTTQMIHPNDIVEYISELKAKIIRLSDILSKID
jgi:hypothetical protein